VPHAPITPIEDVWDLDFVAETACRTTAPDGRTVRLPPSPVPSPALEAVDRTLPFAPAYGEHTGAVLAEAGLDGAEIEDLRSAGVVA
jgi:crotonobetainyl-CoA:carnitine CoA-transferase CaiB-like acyl-CoA transferase